MTTQRQLDAARRHLVAFALGYPEAWEDHPWEETVAKVRTKVFTFFGTGGDGSPLGLTVKLPDSAPVVLDQPYAEPTGYGLGRAGWVSLSIGTGHDLSVGWLEDLIDESYRAVAPKMLVRQLDAERGDGT